MTLTVEMINSDPIGAYEALYQAHKPETYLHVVEDLTHGHRLTVVSVYIELVTEDSYHLPTLQLEMFRHVGIMGGDVTNLFDAETIENIENDSFWDESKHAPIKPGDSAIVYDFGTLPGKRQVLDCTVHAVILYKDSVGVKVVRKDTGVFIGTTFPAENFIRNDDNVWELK